MARLWRIAQDGVKEAQPKANGAGYAERGRGCPAPGLREARGLPPCPTHTRPDGKPAPLQTAFDLAMLRALI